MTQEKSDAQLAQKVEHQSAKVLQWRLVLNLALMAFDAVVYFCVGLLVMVISKEMNLFTTRLQLNLHISAYLYVAVCAIIWVACAHLAGVYHRHVFADGYQLNILLLKAMLFCWVGVCALNFVLQTNVSFFSVCMTSLCVWVAEMIVRFVARRFLTYRHRKGDYAYPTVIVGSPEGIGQILKFLRQRKQLNYKPVRVCPIRANHETGLIEADPNTDILTTMVRESWGEPIEMIEYGDHLAGRIAQTGAQTVMVTDVLDRFSDNLSTFAVQMESLNLEIALITSALDIAEHATQMRNIQGVTDVLDRFSDNLSTFAVQMESLNLEIALITSALDIAEHATQMRNIQGVSIMTISLPQYSPVAKVKKRIFDIVVSSLAIVLSSWVMLIVAIAIKIEDGGPVFYKQERIGLRGKPFYIHKFRSMRVDADKHLKEVLAANGQEMGARYKLKHDPRITKVGNFIRKTSCRSSSTCSWAT